MEGGAESAAKWVRIALVVHDLHKHGGHALYTRVLADALSERHDVTVFANTCDRPDGARWTHEYVWARRRTAIGTVASFPVGLRKHGARLGSFDIVHAQGYCGGVPHVVTAHMCMASFRRAVDSPSLTNRATLWAMEQFEARFYQRFHGQVIAPSRRTAAELSQHYGVAERQISVIHHGVDTERFNPAVRKARRLEMRQRFGLPPDARIALYVGDLTKAHSCLRQLAERRPDIQLIIVSRSLRYRWPARNVIFAGATREPQAYYAMADYFLFPSTNEPFGMVVLEAMASGLPVICSDRAGASELIRSGANGFVFPLDRWVNGALEVMALKSDALAAIATSGLMMAGQQSWSRVVDRTEAVYRVALQAKSDAAAAGCEVSR